MNIHGTRVSSRSCVTWLGITDPQTKLRLNTRHDFQARILERSQAIRVEYQVFLQFFKHQCLKTRELDLVGPTCTSAVSQSATRRIPIVRSPLEVPEESTVQEKKSFTASFVAFLLSSDQNVSAVFAMPPMGSSEKWRQCHFPHNSCEP